MSVEQIKKELKNAVFKSKEDPNTIEHVDLTYTGFFRLISKLIKEVKQEEQDRAWSDWGDDELIEKDWNNFNE